MTVDKPSVEKIENALLQFGALSVTFSDALDQPQYEPLPGETKLWDRTQVTGLFENQAPTQTIQSYLSTHGLIATADAVTTEVLQDQVWERAWLKDFKPMKFGQSLWICPTGFEVEDNLATVIDLDPGLAFGTGTHATTALCLEWLDQHPPRQQQVIDYGCGSGILGIAALKLQARHCTAVDIDPQALEASAANAQKNHVEARLTCCLPNAFQAFSADIVLANILAEPLIQLADTFVQLVKPEGHIVLSGILHEQADAVGQAYAPYFSMDPIQRKGDWVRLSGQRKTNLVQVAVEDVHSSAIIDG